MNANDVIEAYVADVAAQLPRAQRNDVAFELRALLHEELQGRADDAGRAPDAAMATALLQAFGRPADVAARYRPALTIIDPADGRLFLRATVIGMALICGLGLLAQLGQPIESGGDVLRVLGAWWGGTVVASLWWPGVLVAGFGMSAWMRRRWPQSGAWKPLSRDRIQGGRGALVLAIVAIICGIALLLDPHRILDVLWGGRAAPQAYAALTYTDTFLAGPAPWILVLLVLNVPLYAAVIVNGRWTPTLRRIEMILGLVDCAVLAWALFAGPIMMTGASDQAVRLLLALIVLACLANFALQLHRGVRPAPDAKVVGGH